MSSQEMVEMLRGVQFLHDIPDEYLRQIASIAEVREVPEGGVLFREGQQHRNIYFVIKGSVALEIHVSERLVKRIQTVNEGELLGWSSVVTHASTTATARAVQPSRVAAVDAHQLKALCEHNPQFGFEFMKRTAQTMAKRLGATRLQLLDVYRDVSPAIPAAEEV